MYYFTPQSSSFVEPLSATLARELCAQQLVSIKYPPAKLSGLKDWPLKGAGKETPHPESYLSHLLPTGEGKAVWGLPRARVLFSLSEVADSNG